MTEDYKKYVDNNKTKLGGTKWLYMLKVIMNLNYGI
jgi:hypothetical protein